MSEAGRLFRNAIELDENFALAHVGLADTLAISVDGNQANIAVQKALELDPNLAEAHALQGFVRMFHDWNWRGAEASFAKSIELNPNYATAHHWYATLLAVEGRNDEAKAEMRRALEINPLSPNFHADLGQIYYFNREYKEAEKSYLKALEIYPDFIFAHEYLSDIYLKTGEYDKAVETFIKAEKINNTYANETAERQRQLEAYYETRRKSTAPAASKNLSRIRSENLRTQTLPSVTPRSTFYWARKKKPSKIWKRRLKEKRFWRSSSKPTRFSTIYATSRATEKFCGK